MTDVRKLLCGIVWVAACFCAPCVFAQQQEDAAPPKPAAHDYAPLVVPGADIQEAEQNTETAQPDNWPVSGIQNLTLGTPPVRHSYWVPGIQYSNTYSSGGLGASSTGAKPGWNTTSFVSGDVSLLQEWSGSALSMNYSGGGYFSSDKAQGNGQYQQLAATYEIDGKRWKGLLIDQFSRLPESSFGFGGATGLSTGVGGTLGAPQAGLQSNYVPNQSIYTGTGSRYSNSTGIQISLQVSPRGAVTVGGVYGIFRFANQGSSGSDTANFNVGYDYTVTRRDTIGLSYGFGTYHFPGGSQAIGDQVVQINYGRKITGRMALRVSGGPDITTFRVPIGGLTQKISGSANAGLSYAFAHSNMTFNYTHAVSNGGGVLNGANTDQVSVALTRQLTRVVSGHVNVGYAKNRQLGSSSSANFDTWFVGAGVSRPLGRTATMSLGYQSQIQTANQAVCGLNCATNYNSHQIFLSFQWHTLPFVLR